MSNRWIKSNHLRSREVVSEDLVLSRSWLKSYDDNLKEIKFLQKKIQQKRESLDFMYSRTELRIVKTSNKNFLSNQNHLHAAMDAIAEIEQRIQYLLREQEEKMSYLDEFVERDCALVIRSYHELGMNFSQIGELYHMGRSTANRRYWRGMKSLENALKSKADLAA